VRGRFSNRRRGVGLALAGVLVLGGLFAWERLRLNAMERRLVGIWIEAQDSDSILSLRNRLLTLHPDGRYKEELGWIEGETDLRWRFQSGSIHGTWWCEGDELFLRHFSNGPVHDLWDTIVARWKGTPRWAPERPEQIRLRLDSQGILTFVSDSRKFTIMTGAYPGDSLAPSRYEAWEQLSRSSTDRVVAEPDPQRQLDFEEAMDRKNSW